MNAGVCLRVYVFVCVCVCVCVFVSLVGSIFVCLSNSMSGTHNQDEMDIVIFEGRKGRQENDVCERLLFIFSMTSSVNRL